MNGSKPADCEARDARRRSQPGRLSIGVPVLWIALILAAACQAGGATPASAARSSSSIEGPTETTDVAIAAAGSRPNTDSELTTSAPASWGRGAVDGWSRDARLQDEPEPSPTTPDEADEQADVPPCSDIAFPAETAEELVWGPFDVYGYGLDDDSRPWARDPEPADDGRHKVVALHLPRHPDSPQDLLIVHSDDEGAAAVHTVRLIISDSLHPSLRTSAHVGDIVVTPERWFLPVTLTTFLDLDRLVPGDVDRQAIDVSSINVSHDTSGAPGMTLGGYYDGQEGESLPFECFVSWEQMDVNPDLFSEWFLDYAYGIPNTSPYPDIDQVTGYILTARWGEEPVQAELPTSHGRCCKIEVLDTGFVAISYVVPDGAYPWPEYAPIVHFSFDGLKWDVVDLPTRYVSYDGEPRWEVPIWICSVTSGQSGVVIRQSRRSGWDRCLDFTYWTADADLTNWRKLLAPPPGFGAKADN